MIFHTGINHMGVCTYLFTTFSWFGQLLCFIVAVWFCLWVLVVLACNSCQGSCFWHSVYRIKVLPSLQHAIYLVSPSVTIGVVYLNLQDCCFNAFLQNYIIWAHTFPVLTRAQWLWSWLDKLGRMVRGIVTILFYVFTSLQSWNASAIPATILYFPKGWTGFCHPLWAVLMCKLY